MARKTLSDNFDTAQNAAWREYGKQHYRTIVGWQLVKVAAPFVLCAVAVGLPVVYVVRWMEGLSAPGLPVSAGPWPWVLLGVSASIGTALIGYRWANPLNGGRALIAGIIACLFISAFAVWWAQAAT